MRLRKLLTVLSLVAVCSVAGATEQTITDQSWWAKLSPHEREIAMFAALDGYGAGYGQGRLAGISETARPVGAIVGEVMKPKPQELTEMGKRLSIVMQRIKDDRSASPKFGGEDISVYVSRMSAFYDKYPEAARATIGEVAQCLARHPSIPCSDLAKYAANQR